MTTKTFTLKHPITRDGAQPITELTGRRAKVRDMQKFMKMLDSGDASKAMQEVLADLMTQPAHVILDLDIDDYAPMVKWFQDFLAPMKQVSED